MKKICLLLIMVWSSFGVSSLSAGQIARSGPLKVPLIEVYTSEGCSSCVPAWAWLNRMENDPGLWKDFVPVGFHVDYWDYLGWKDALAQNRFSQRQRAYAAEWGKGSVYTPGFVLNGKEWRSWYGSGALDKLEKDLAGNLSIESARDGVINISFAPRGPDMRQNFYEAHIVLLNFGVVSKITSGENRGRTVSHDFAVVSYSRQDLKPGHDGTFYAEAAVQFPDARNFSKKGIAVWITEPGSMEPVQAAGGFAAGYL